MKSKIYHAINYSKKGANSWTEDVPYSDNKGFVMLTDPVGCSELSEKASKLAVRIASEKLRNEMNHNLNKDAFIKLMDYVISLANVYVKKRNTKANKIKKQEPGSTTLDICTVLNNNLYVGHVGDGRVYALYKNGEFKLITEDETHAWLSYTQGHFDSPDEIKVDPSSRSLKNAVGFLDSITVKHYDADFTKIDSVLIASDGFYKCLLDEEIMQIMLQENNPRNALKSLVDITKNPQGIIPLAVKVNKCDEETAKALLKQDSKSAILLKNTGS